MDLSRWVVEGPDAAPLSTRDPASTEGGPGGRHRTEDATVELVEQLRDLQLRLFAEGTRSLLVVLQGIDAAGKDGTVSHVFSGCNPLGVRVHAFKVPSAEERAHDFLWRIHARCPAAGEIMIFNRSQYEDVIVPTVHGTLPADAVDRRYEAIRAFEAQLTDAGTTVVKFLLHVSAAEQLERLDERLRDPEKRWKSNMGDFAERELWDQYQAAFGEVLGRTSTASAPWVVVPADHKWFRNWLVSAVLVERLRALDPQFPSGEPPTA